MPRRIRSGGVEPGVEGPEAQASLRDSKQWSFSEIEPTHKEIKALLAASVRESRRFSSAMPTPLGQIFSTTCGGGP